MQKIRFLSGNALKLIAAAAMLVDHIGLIFFPRLSIFRIIGRLAFPIFAFMIAEGCRHTRNKLRHFFTMAAIAAICQTVYFVALKDMSMSVFVTFSISILLVYFLQYMKKTFWSTDHSRLYKIFIFISFFLVLYSNHPILTVALYHLLDIIVDFFEQDHLL